MQNSTCFRIVGVVTSSEQPFLHVCVPKSLCFIILLQTINYAKKNSNLFFFTGGVDAVEVHANEFTFEESISTGEIERKVESPIDKAQQFKSILQNRKKDEEKSILTVYIGDSVGDLLCLLEADIGIVVASSSSLRRVGSHFGVSFVPLFSGIVQKQKQEETWKGLSGTLYTVSSWAEIHSFALGWE